jgi:hypothetical protein
MPASPRAEGVARDLGRYARSHGRVPLTAGRLQRGIPAIDRAFFAESFALAVTHGFLAPARRSGGRGLGWVAGPVAP